MSITLHSLAKGPTCTEAILKDQSSLSQFKVLSWESFCGQDGIVDPASPPDLDVGKACSGEECCILRSLPLSALRLHQHVEGIQLGSYWAAIVFMQERFHQQHAATWPQNTAGSEKQVSVSHLGRSGTLEITHGSQKSLALHD